jgi:hypothetical protein
MVVGFCRGRFVHHPQHFQPSGFSENATGESSELRFCCMPAAAAAPSFAVRHGLEVAAYRTRWNLPLDHPLTAPTYSARRSARRSRSGSAGGGPRSSRRPNPDGGDARGRRRRTNAIFPVHMSKISRVSRGSRWINLRRVSGISRLTARLPPTVNPLMAVAHPTITQDPNRRATDPCPTIHIDTAGTPTVFSTTSLRHRTPN